MFAHAVGYYFTTLGSTGLEAFRNGPLTGQTGTNLQNVLDQLQGHKPSGDKVITTLDPGAQRRRQRGARRTPRRGRRARTAQRRGQGDGLDPRLRPQLAESAATAARIESDPSGRLVNRATQFGYAPGSTFKVLTATAAIDTGAFTPYSTVSGRNDVPISGVPLQNDENESFGQITLTEALAKSVNTVWAQVAERLGKHTMARYMERFGFDRKPQLDYPAEQMSSSGEYSGERLLSPTSPRVDVGRMGIGQDKLEVTALQMAEVAAAVANRGTLMTPHLTSRIVDPEGRTVQMIGPHVQSVVMKPSTADGRDGDDGSRRQRRHRHLSADTRRPGGGQDGHGRDADRDHDQQRLVHRLRAGRRAARGDRRHAAGGPRPGRRVRRARRARSDRKALA